MDIENILKQLTLEEKAALVSGTDFMYRDAWNRSWSRDGCFLLSADTG